LIQAPTAIIRGAWDSLCTDADAAWLCDRIPNASDKTVPRATHLMHLEENRYALYRETEAFLTSARD
jgi:pimeloyl-ACP methyl ester carboxylesterase